MNLRQVSVFVRVVEVGSFAAAARELGLPRSAVSQAISGLERELGLRLLTRSNRALTMTDAGATLHRRAAPALRDLALAEQELTDTAGPLRGTVRLTAPVEVGNRLLEPMLSEFLVANPGVTLDLLLTGQVLDFATHGIDLAIRGGPVKDGSLVARALSTEAAWLVAAPGYVRSHGTPRKLEDLTRHACIASRVNGGRATWRLLGPHGADSVSVTPKLVVEHYGYAVRAACHGVGIAALPRFLCAEELRQGTLVRVLPRYGLEPTTLWLVAPSRRYVPRAVAAVREALVKGFRQR